MNTPCDWDLEVFLAHSKSWLQRHRLVDLVPHIPRAGKEPRLFGESDWMTKWVVGPGWGPGDRGSGVFPVCSLRPASKQRCGVLWAEVGGCGTQASICFSQRWDSGLGSAASARWAELWVGGLSPGWTVPFQNSEVTSPHLRPLPAAPVYTSITLSQLDSLKM